MSASMMDALLPLLEGGNVQQVSRQLGVGEAQASTAIKAAVPLLVGALQRNASSQSGLDSLAGALDRDHDGSILDNLGGFLGNPQAGPGDGILGHLLGGKRPAVEQGISRSSGMSIASTGKLLTMLAPLLLGALGRQQKQQGLDVSSLAGLLGQEQQEVQRRAPEAMGLAGALLDADGDGDVEMDDIAKKGLGMLGEMFGKGS